MFLAERQPEWTSQLLPPRKCPRARVWAQGCARWTPSQSSIRPLGLAECWGPAESSKGVLATSAAGSLLYLPRFPYLTSLLKYTKHKFSKFPITLIFLGHLLCDGCSQCLWDACYLFSKFILVWNHMGATNVESNCPIIPHLPRETWLGSEWGLPQAFTRSSLTVATFQLVWVSRLATSPFFPWLPGSPQGRGSTLQFNSSNHVWAETTCDFPSPAGLLLLISLFPRSEFKKILNTFYHVTVSVCIFLWNWSYFNCQSM